jgi:Uncharacterized membrane-bound protein
MLWSLIKVLLFVAAIGAATIGVGRLLEMDAGLLISVGTVEFTLGPLQMLVVALLLVLAVWILLKLIGLLVAVIRFVNGDDTAVSRYFDRNRERRGHQAVSDAVLALASGDGKLAMAKAARAERLLDERGMTRVITAQAAEMVGDRKKAEASYRKLLEEDRTRFIGVRGLMQQKLAHVKI